MKWFKNKEIYSITNLTDEYVSLIVAVYQNSQFTIIFNQRLYLDHNLKSDAFKKLGLKGKLLAQLIQKAQKQLKFTLNNISYNLPIEKLKIVPHEYFYKFPQPTLFNQVSLRMIHDKFLKNYEKEKDYQNFLFKINQYILLDEKLILTKPPFNQTISSIKIKGYLYQIWWKQLYEYMEIFRNAKVKQHKPILLPYAMYINLLFSQRTNNLVLILWNNKQIQLFAFENKIFTQYTTLDEGLDHLIDQISYRLNADRADVKHYLFSLFHFNEKKDKTNQKLNFLIDLQSKQFKQMREEIFSDIEGFFRKIVDKMQILIQEKLFLEQQQTAVFVLGKVTQIGGFNDFIQSINKQNMWKVYDEHFVGLKDYQDLFLIGNAYYQHLQNKVLLTDLSTSSKNS